MENESSVLGIFYIDSDSWGICKEDKPLLSKHVVSWSW